MLTRLIAAALVGLATLVPPAASLATADALPDARPRVVGGTEAEPGRYGFAVAIVESTTANAWYGFRCGGSLIGTEWVLTAASCVDGAAPSHIEAVVARHDLATNTGYRVGVEKIYLHPRYSPGAGHHDGALLRLSAPVPVDPIDLAPPDAAPATPSATVIGWGDTHTDERSPRALHEVDVDLADGETCLDIYGDDFDSRFHLCAGDPDHGGVDACDGDEGGPLFAGTDGSWEQIGVHSWGFGCGEPGFPGVYTSIDALRPWIRKVAGIGDFTCDGKAATIVGTGGVDFITGTPGDDVIVSLGARDVITSLGGNDTICSGSGRDQIDAGSGDDVVLGGPGHDTIDGGDGRDVLSGDAGHDTIDGGDGDDTIDGSLGNDRLVGGAGDDVLTGGGDDDTVDGSSGADRVLGNVGDDELLGGPGDDYVNGGAGSDRLDGGDGDDTLIGGSGDDTLTGGTGSDLASGSSGVDRCSAESTSKCEATME
ncbi:MAG: trypsin-like serine protease [Actinobacteria bacterium]|nr:trypsin-like serine protease [Actinomycetota bacterium]